MIIFSKKETNLKKNGFSYYPKLLSKIDINRFFESTLDLLNSYNDEKKRFKNFDDIKLSNYILNKKKRDTKFIKYLYNSLPHFSSLINLFENKKIRHIASKILNEKPSNLIICEHQLRIDYPKDTNFILKAHQDSSFYPQDGSTRQSLVCNISLHNITANMGSTILYKNSHTRGNLRYNKKFSHSKKQSTQRQIKEKELDNFEEITIETKPGDVSFYDMNLIHRSGVNISKKIRFSIIARIFNPLHKKFKAFQKISKIIK